MPVLVVGDAVVPSGFARVLHSILGQLRDRYEFHHLGVNYNGEPHQLGWEVYPAGTPGDPFGAPRIKELLEKVRPRLVFMLNDLWVLSNYMAPLTEAAGRLEPFKIVAYSPVDAGPLEPELLERLRGVDRLVAYTHFGKREMEKALRSPEPRVGRCGAEIAVIPHGVDTNLFFPLARELGDGERAATSRARARKTLFTDPELFDAWIVLNANRNQPRKRIDITMKGFTLFARDKPKRVRLYLHMGIEDCGWNVVALARRYGIEDRLIITAEERFLPAVSDEMLNCIYNACDVGINTSLGEGWGLVSLEHAATGAAQVVPRHSACEELWTGAAALLEPAMSLTVERILTEGQIVAPEEVARRLEELYQSPALLRQLSAAAYAVATRPAYSWSQVAGQWHQLFQQVMAERVFTPA
ncbi:MAG TPA: glycosyltransferase family 4 protein [Thermoanaerobaculia bacterium]|nr:glycosyltransferase family 4 protein [Thermoanaerobaculia bacterium]